MAASLKSRLPIIAAELRPRVSAAVKATAEKIAEDAALRAPAGPGSVHLKDHFRVERRGPAEYAVLNDAEAESGRPVPYAIAVEFGHTAKDGSQVPPHPFLVPVTQENEDYAEQLALAALRGL